MKSVVLALTLAFTITSPAFAANNTAQQPTIKGCTAPMNCVLAMPMEPMQPVKRSVTRPMQAQQQAIPMACLDPVNCQMPGATIFPKNQSI